MHFFSTLLIGIALSFDTMAVAAVHGARNPRLPVRNALYIALLFGFFHFLMPVIGWFLGVGLERLISTLDHWVAFSLLSIVGLKMLWGALHHDGESPRSLNDLHTLLILALACSIDALVVGMSFGLLPVAIIPAALTIGLTTCVLSFTSVYIGKRFGEAWSSKTEVFGGLILVGIGIKILVDHLLAI